MLPSTPQLLYVPRKPAVASGAPLAFDGGSTVSETTASSNLSLTTTGGSGMIVLGFITAGTSTTVSSITSGGILTFTAESVSPSATNGGTDNCFMYTAPYSTNFSGTITINFSGSVFHTAQVVAFSGAKTSAADDSGGPVANTTVGPAITTTNANDAVVTFFETGGSADTAGAGWTAVPGSDAGFFGFMEYRIVSATGTYTATLNSGAGNMKGGIITAIKQGP